MRKLRLRIAEGSQDPTQQEEELALTHDLTHHPFHHSVPEELRVGACVKAQILTCIFVRLCWHADIPGLVPSTSHSQPSSCA